MAVALTTHLTAFEFVQQQHHHQHHQSKGYRPWKKHKHQVFPKSILSIIELQYTTQLLLPPKVGQPKSYFCLSEGKYLNSSHDNSEEGTRGWLCFYFPALCLASILRNCRWKNLHRHSWHNSIICCFSMKRVFPRIVLNLDGGGGG